MNYASYIALIPLLPLVSFLVLGIGGRGRFKQSAGWIATLLLAVSAGLALFTAYQYFLVDGKIDGVYPTLTVLQHDWLRFSPSVTINMGMVIDPLSVMMLVVVTMVSFMVHLFSLGYMHGEERFSTYYAFLGLFTFSMLGLVVSSNIFQIYIFWELVGVSSYLLIGFYYQKASAVAAAKKAFIVTRFADLGFLVGILILGFNGNTLDFNTLIQRLTDPQSPYLIGMTTSSFLGISMISWALVLVFVGGAGKSAMFPLHIWLPDAMEGPTPVSALIHAATMVVAGVFLVARMFPLFYVNHLSLQVVTWVGAASALFAALIACTQTDIKRVLAYSTMSQIGYMMFALGVSGYGGEAGLGYTGSLFHLFTHAFFKSLLFLGAGAIIHLVHSNEMKDMGGLRKYMPITHITFLVACLAIAGVPPFAGFFSKEEILLAAYEHNPAVYYLGLITSGITAFYMFRLYFNIFWNKPTEVHAHGEGTLSMKIPLIVLALATIIVGFVPFSHYLSSDNRGFESHLHLGFSIAPVLIGLAGIGLAFLFYFKQNDRAAKVSGSLGALYKAAYHKFYIDEIYLFVTKKILFNLVGRPAAWIDRNIIDGLMNGIAVTTAELSNAIKGIQSGRVQQYALYFFGGVLALAVLFIFFW
ncbi:MAG: NADH-quinone oxidoreductase subunit L [Chitinophagales bacterium]|nr:NADH-quinone oxidoreductase subunit L [Chitinophagales bacterium]